jgi:hypothetical protein
MRRWFAVGGITLPLLWTPMVLIVPRLPDLGSPRRIVQFYACEHATLKLVITLASAGFLPLLALLAALADRLWRDPASRALVLTALASAVMFMTSLAVALGLAAAAALTSDIASAELLYALHAAAFVLAAPVAPAGVAFFVAIAIIPYRDAVPPR